jgi:hypothetical protein
MTPFSYIWAPWMRRGVFQARHFRGHSDSGGPDETRHIFGGHSGSGERHSWKLQSIRRSPCPQKCHTASIKYKQLRILKMATRFIAYVPKPTKENHISKSLCKSTLKEFSTSDNNHGDDGIMVEGMLTHHISCC